MAISSVSTGDSDIPSPSEMKDDHEFKPLQGNQAFFRVRASRSPFHLRQRTQGPSHMPIAKGKLHLGASGNLAHLIIQRQGISFHLETI